MTSYDMKLYQRILLHAQFSPAVHFIAAIPLKQAGYRQ